MGPVRFAGVIRHWKPQQAGGFGSAATDDAFASG